MQFGTLLKFQHFLYVQNSTDMWQQHITWSKYYAFRLNSLLASSGLHTDKCDLLSLHARFVADDITNAKNIESNKDHISNKASVHSMCRVFNKQYTRVNSSIQTTTFEKTSKLFN